MINGFFNFLHTPFERNLPPDALFVSPVLESLQSRLSYVVNNRFFSVVTGGPGCGKTTIIRKFITTLDPSSTLPLYVSESNLSPRNFYFAILEQLGVKPHFYRGDAKRQLVRELTPLSSSKNIVIILDEAHLCDMEMLTEIRFLLNFDMDSNSPLSLILVGQSELRDTLKKQAYEAIAQRIDLRCHIPPLDRVHTGDYINAHLAYAANSSPDCFNIFTQPAIDAIFQFSLGIPRKINRVASLCLLHAVQVNKRYVDDHMVSLIVDSELSW